MSIVEFLRIVHRNLILMLACGTLLGVLMYTSTSKKKPSYSSTTLVNTGLVSGYSIESSNGGKIDYGFTNNELENLISLAGANNTMKELAFLMLARLTDQHWVDSMRVLPENLDLLKTDLGPELWEKLSATKNLDDKLALITSEWEKGQGTTIYDLINSKNEFIGLEHLASSYQVIRSGNSDMIRFNYKTIDPGVCKGTLLEHTQLFIRKHKMVKEGQSTNVMSFFEQATKESAAELREIESSLLKFQVDNKIINYYEQTRYIAAKNEDLEETYMRELMSLVSADSAIVTLEARMANFILVPQLHDALAKKREELRIVAAQQADASLFIEDDSMKRASKKYDVEASRLKSELKQVTQATFTALNTTEGVPIEQLMTPWLSAIIQSEEAKARISIIKQRRADFEVIYGKFAPWGSTLKRIEREIDVRERAYLENLHSFNQARLHQYSQMMSTNLRVVDAPPYPANAEKAKSVMMAVVGFLAGVVIPLAMLIALELMDRGLTNPNKAVQITELELATALPQVPRKRRQQRRIDFEKLNSLMCDLLVRHIQLGSVMHPDLKLIGISSSNIGSGKSYVLTLLANQMIAKGLNPLVLQPDDSAAISADIPQASYPAQPQTFQKKPVVEILNEVYPDWESHDYVLVELPAWKKGSFPVMRLGELQYHMWVIQAGQTWSDSDKKAVETLAHACGLAPSLVLNRLRPDTLEDLIGDIPRKRSQLRVLVKRIAKMQFSKS